MDYLIFFIILKQKLTNAAIQIVFVNNLCKALNLVCNLNTSSLRVYAQVIVTIL